MEIRYLYMNYIGNVARRPEIFYKFSNTSFAPVKAGQEIMQDDLLSGGGRRKRSMAALRWISFDVSSIGLENLVPPAIQ